VLIELILRTAVRYLTMARIFPKNQSPAPEIEIDLEFIKDRCLEEKGQFQL